jgi:polysaccharide deacetylase family protein (PEP-CTERM system associated)
MRHHFTVDVEEYFQVSAMEPHAPAAAWDSFESRVRSATNALLELLDETGSKGTFFVLGWIAERHPQLLRSITAAGHEVASHGSRHQRVTTMTPEQFRLCARDSKAVLEDICGEAVLGFRAPSFSIVPGLEWALDVLVEEGYVYDSSLFPVKRRGYGFPRGKREPHWLERPAGRLLEVPPTTLRRAGVNLPAAGGAYFRLLPHSLVRSALRESERAGVPGTFYIHPWEVDPAQPRLDVPWATRLRHYGGLARTLPRLRLLCREFRFDSIANSLALRPAACRIS